MDESSEKHNSLSRRVLLKDIMAVGSTTLLRKPIKYLESQKPQIEKLQLPEYSYETSYAYFIPVTEVHHEHTIEVYKLLSYKIKLDAHFNESTEQTIRILNSEPGSILFSASKSPEAKTSHRMFPDEMLIRFAQDNTYLSIEGLDLPPHLYTANNIMLWAESTAGYSLFLKAVRDKIKPTQQNEEKPVNKIEVNSILKTLGIAWLLTPPTTLVTTAILKSNIAERSELLKSIGDISERINNISFHTHPELMTIFFRSIIMARKLDLLAKELPKHKTLVNDKPVISYSVGRGHGGIKDLIYMDDKTEGNFTLSLLSIYPDLILKNIVLYNHLGKMSNEDVDSEKIRIAIETFCSTILVPVKSNLDGQEVKHIVVDEKLKQYLEARLNK